jgi:hypothetical protein
VSALSWKRLPYKLDRDWREKMTWRGSFDVKDRIFGALVYLFAIFDALPFGVFLFKQFPFLQFLFVPLTPIFLVYGALGSFAGLIIFFILFLAVVRNPRISRFIRFNTLQAILIGILLALFGFAMNILGRGLGDNLITETLYNVIFLASMAACIYSIVQSALGRYAEIPAISDAANSQLPW